MVKTAVPHSTRGISPSSPTPLSSGNSVEDKAERIQEPEGNGEHPENKAFYVNQAKVIRTYRD